MATERRPVPVEELAKYVAEAGNPSNERELSYAEVTLPRRFLAGGLVIVDTPGVGGIGSAHSAATLAALPTADAVLLVSDAAQEYSEPEIDFLRQAMKLCPNVACVLTKTDLYPQWRQGRRIGPAAPGAGRDRRAAASRSPRLCAFTPWSTKDADLNVESGFRALSDHLQQNILAKTSDLARKSVVNDVQYVGEHLALSIQGEMDALRDPAHNQEFVAELEKARDEGQRAAQAHGPLAERPERRHHRPDRRHRVRLS